jgi:hypothetical protein
MNNQPGLGVNDQEPRNQQQRNREPRNQDEEKLKKEKEIIEKQRAMLIVFFKFINNYYEKIERNNKRINNKNVEVKHMIHIQQLIESFDMLSLTIEYGRDAMMELLPKELKLDQDKEFIELQETASKNLKNGLTSMTKNLESMDEYFNSVIDLSLGHPDSNYGNSTMKIVEERIKKNGGPFQNNNNNDTNQE